MKTSMVGFVAGLCICLLVSFSGVAEPIAGDISKSGSVDAVDVQLVINGALGVSIAESTDVDYSGLTDAVDVQLVINAALGIVTGEDAGSTVTVPNVIGLLQSDAETIIINAGLAVEQIPSVYEVYSDTVDVGCVIGLYPAVGTVVAEGSFVDEFYVSRGPESGIVTVPNVRGMYSGHATSAIAAAGLNLGIKFYEYSDTVGIGRIISQNPFAGTVVAGGSVVDLHVSRRPPSVYVTVPNVRGMYWGHATSAIATAGLNLGIKFYEFSDTVGRGRIVRQDPAAGTIVGDGSDVDLYLSVGPEPAPPPGYWPVSPPGHEIPANPPLDTEDIANPLQVVSTEVRLLEESYGYVTYSWKVDVRNLSGDTVEGYVEVNLYDSEGFLLATRTSLITIEGSSTVTITGTSLIETDLWDQVARYDAIAYLL